VAFIDQVSFAPLGPRSGHLYFNTPFFLKCEYFINQNIMKYMAFSTGGNFFKGDNP